MCIVYEMWGFTGSVRLGPSRSELQASITLDAISFPRHPDAGVRKPPGGQLMWLVYIEDASGLIPDRD